MAQLIDAAAMAQEHIAWCPTTHQLWTVEPSERECDRCDRIMGKRVMKCAHAILVRYRCISCRATRQFGGKI